MSVIAYRDVPPDMFTTIHTLFYAAHRANIDELVIVRAEIAKVYGKEFAQASESDPSNVNETIRENINVIMPESGRKVSRLLEIAADEGIKYVPSEKCNAVYSNVHNIGLFKL